MEPITAEQFIESVRSWKPEGAFKGGKLDRLGPTPLPPGMAEELGDAFDQCSQCCYDYLQQVNELVVSKTLDRAQFLPWVAQLGKSVQNLLESGRRFGEAFRRYDATVRPRLRKDRFDTLYYDAIQGLAIREILKKVLGEVEAVLQSLSLVSAELSQVRCADLYEDCVRFQMFYRYFTSKEKFSDEELWSVLFDVYSQMEEMGKKPEAPTPEELEELQEKVKKYRAN